MFKNGDEKKIRYKRNFFLYRRWKKICEICLETFFVKQKIKKMKNSTLFVDVLQFIKFKCYSYFVVKANKNLWH